MLGNLWAKLQESQPGQIFKEKIHTTKVVNLSLRVLHMGQIPTQLIIQLMLDQELNKLVIRLKQCQLLVLQAGEYQTVQETLPEALKHLTHKKICHILTNNLLKLSVRNLLQEELEGSLVSPDNLKSLMMIDLTISMNMNSRKLLKISEFQSKKKTSTDFFQSLIETDQAELTMMNS